MTAMEAFPMNRRRNAIGSLGIFLGLALGTVAFGQVRNDPLYEDIVDGQVTELRLNLAAGTRPNTEIFLPGDDQAFSLLELSVLAKNDNAAVHLLQVGATAESLTGQFGSSSILEVLAQQGMVLTLATYIDQEPSVLVEAGPDPVSAAIWYGHTSAAQLLLERMSAVVGQDKLQTTLDEALIVAAARNAIAAIQMLLAQGASGRSGLPLLAVVADCSAEAVEGLLIDKDTEPNPYYEGEHVASFALRCFQAESQEDAALKFAQIIQLLHDAGSAVCPVLVGTPGDESSEIEAALQNLGLCQ